MEEPPQQPPPDVAAAAKDLPLVLILEPLYPSFEEGLSKRFRFLKPWESSSQQPLEAFLADHADSIRVVFCAGPFKKIDSAIISALPRLQLVLTPSAGMNHIDLAECRRKGIAVANAGTVFSVDTADYAVGLVLDVLRRVSAADRFVRGGLWPVEGKYPLGSKLSGKRVGIVGLGSIGSEIAKRLDAFGCIISYTTRTRKPSSPYSYFQNICDLAADSDILIIVCPLTDETRHIVNRDVLLALGKKGVIINVGRGPLIDEKELVRCLVEGEVGGAGLDVFENEPTVPQELFLLDNVVLSPHKAVLTPESVQELLQLVIANLEAFFSNQPLLTPV
ncbi:Glyoxylate/hydroxypyruvate reductase HPR3 [Acorus calamus]|uniref:Glyoxylate/hydroxypyruvate reductase HPR3 n=1 Tax=Acorus calamus TaxID=4465 RepID=A0AAV9DWL8_ACOCL|nr:Glyoxylate/hydroxypyruvate reductase HPR3 [Acorus calamus]